MKITFLGTGAADWDWETFPAGTRGSTSTLLGTTCLLDAGATAEKNFRRAGVSPRGVTDLLVTHSHRDHFTAASVRFLAESSKRPLRVWASEQALSRLPDGLCEKHAIHAGDTFRAAGCAVTALPANHALPDPDEESFHFVFVSPKVRLLYALDGAWMLSRAKALLVRALGGKPLDAAVLDATSGDSYNDWRFADHNDARMASDVFLGLRASNLATDRTLLVFDHVARTLWPKTDAARARIAAKFGAVLAEDGAELEV